ncbi:hypothetical protein [Labrenzia sp. DG1229]|uniref:hypothetical protein n=1 Tax=Labrenzia sp. DG1229 TaxID=681847 RepID=UPI000B2EA754|nr:hypothetical protein [Labrenzia sp. DG1229]
MDQIRSDAKCRAELNALHPREKAALGKILINASRYGEFEISEASAACYDPGHDYLDLIECWELLATKMAAGEDIKPEVPKPVVGLSERAGEIFSELPPTQQKSIVLCVRGRVNINFQDTVAHNLKLGGSDALWALKINGFENAQMSRLAKAANWTEMTGYYEMEADNASKLIRGEIGFEKYRLLSKDSQKLLSAALTRESSWQSAHNRNFQKFARECEELATKIIGSAKVAASE